MTNIYYKVIYAETKEAEDMGFECDIFVFSDKRSYLNDGGPVYEDINRILHDLDCMDEVECFHDLDVPLEDVLAALRKNGYNPIHTPDLLD